MGCFHRLHIFVGHLGVQVARNATEQVLLWFQFTRSPFSFSREKRIM
jgi:hypothetical protein